MDMKKGGIMARYTVDGQDWWRTVRNGKHVVGEITKKED
jgi:hypothetical protein